MKLLFVVSVFDNLTLHIMLCSEVLVSLPVPACLYDTTLLRLRFSLVVIRGMAKKEQIQISEIAMEVGGWVQVSLGFFFFKSSQNIPKPVILFWSSIPCVFCLHF